MRLLKAMAASLYGAGVFVRNAMYDIGLLRSMSHAVPVICVGNITVGGTGKTPMVEFLLGSLLRDGRHPAVLSRGYGRRTKGYREVTAEQSFVNTGDEPMQIKMKFPDVPVVVCEDRNKGVERIMKKYPQTDIVVMDDGFQHRAIRPAVNVVLLDFTRPVSEDHFLPLGNLRDERRQLRRADVVVVTKTPGCLTEAQKSIVAQSAGVREGCRLFFSTMSYGELRPLTEGGVHGEHRETAVVFSGIGNPGPFEEAVGERCKVLESIAFADHHVYTVGDMKCVAKRLEHYGEEQPIAVTTEKDAVKLAGSTRLPKLLKDRLYVLPMKMRFVDEDEREFLRAIYNVIETD